MGDGHHRGGPQEADDRGRRAAREERRRLALEAAKAMLVVEGREGVGLTDVARAAGVDRATVYRCFGSAQRLVEVLHATPASDADRTEVMGVLRRRCADGGLDLDQFADLAAETCAAVTLGDLHDVVRRAAPVV